MTNEMSENNHTPGPWIAEGHSIYGPKHPDSKHSNGRIFIARVEAGSGRGHPDLFGGAERFDFDSKADARLIAAAPELLTALEGLLDALPSATTHPAIAAARATIIKAKGSL